MIGRKVSHIGSHTADVPVETGATLRASSLRDRAVHESSPSPQPVAITTQRRSAFRRRLAAGTLTVWVVGAFRLSSTWCG